MEVKLDCEANNKLAWTCFIHFHSFMSDSLANLADIPARSLIYSEEFRLEL